MFTITGYEANLPCLLCDARNGAFAVTSVRNEINGPLCSKCLTRIVKVRTATAKSESPGTAEVVVRGRAE